MVISTFVCSADELPEKQNSADQPFSVTTQKVEQTIYAGLSPRAALQVCITVERPLPSSNFYSEKLRDGSDDANFTCRSSSLSVFVAIDNSFLSIVS